MTDEQFEALAQLMRLRESPSREALRCVLVDGMSHHDAAIAAGVIRPNVSRQVASANRVIEAARIVAAAKI